MALKSIGENYIMGYLKMRHKHKISGFKPLVMNGMVVNVTEDSLGSKSVCGILRVNVLA